MNEDIEAFMTSRVPLAPPDNLRQTILRKTRGVVRRRRIIRRVSIVAVLLGVYGAGALTALVAQLPKRVEPALANEEPTPPVADSQKPEISIASLLALEWQAIDNTERRADLFQRAGDRYLNEFGDVESALRCYRNALDVGPAADAVVRPDDSWLMISLKQARQKEKHNDSLDS